MSVPATPLLRQWMLLRYLGQRRLGATVRELADELGVTEKTIRRDLVVFQDAGFPLVEEVGERGRKTWSLRTDGRQPPLSFSFDEALALYLGRRLLDPLAGTDLWEASQNAFRKVRTCLGETAVKYLEKMAGSLHHTAPGGGNYERKSHILDTLLQAIEDRRVAMIEYRSQRATEPVTCEVHPYGLVWHRRALYLVAWSRDHGAVRHFKVDRMEVAEATAFPFRRPEKFDLAAHLAGSFGIWQGDGDVTVRVRFEPAAARYVEENSWHASQKLSPQGDGRLLAEFRLSDTTEIKSWILSFGSQAEVLAPEQLREEIRQEMSLLAKRYAIREKLPTTPRQENC